MTTAQSPFEDTVRRYSRDFNDSVSKVMKPLDGENGQQILIGALAIFFWLYISVFSVRMPRELIPYFMNPWVRMGFIAFALWLFTKNAGAAILLVVAYGITTTYFYKNEAEFSSKVGYVTGELKQMVSSPNWFRSESHVRTDKANFPRIVGETKRPAVITPEVAGPKPSVPQAVLSSTGGASTLSNQNIDDQPSGVPANVPTMMEPVKKDIKPHPFSVQPGGTYGQETGTLPSWTDGARGLAPVSV